MRTPVAIAVVLATTLVGRDHVGHSRRRSRLLTEAAEKGIEEASLLWLLGLLRLAAAAIGVEAGDEVGAATAAALLLGEPGCNCWMRWVKPPQRGSPPPKKDEMPPPQPSCWAIPCARASSADKRRAPPAPRPPRSA